MTEPDPMLRALAALRATAPSADLSRKLRAAAEPGDCWALLHDLASRREWQMAVCDRLGSYRSGR